MAAAAAFERLAVVVVTVAAGATVGRRPTALNAAPAAREKEDMLMCMTVD